MFPQGLIAHKMPSRSFSCWSCPSRRSPTQARSWSISLETQSTQQAYSATRTLSLRLCRPGRNLVDPEVSITLSVVFTPYFVLVSLNNLARRCSHCFPSSVAATLRAAALTAAAPTAVAASLSVCPFWTTVYTSDRTTGITAASPGRHQGGSTHTWWHCLSSSAAPAVALACGTLLGPHAPRSERR